MNERPGSPRPTVIRSLAVTADDLVSALEATQRAGRPVVLRVTPPFNGRMRARIHVAGGESEDYTDPAPLHFEPTRFLEADAPTYPEVDETRPDPYDVDEHHTLHTQAVAAWRQSIRSFFRTAITLDTPDGPHEVSVKYLG
ncbi:hypothetical protein ACFQJC_07790 [Haloferax namakaokahaiae]|uniref:DUF8009 domain-containing protein n=1 Tax=Haloferax namakaokahaiae TaxID=1748331 RepID=A0ABD5ZEQ6_9EURY